MAGVQIFVGRVRNVPLGVQTDPGRAGSFAGRPKNARACISTGHVTRTLVQDRPEVRSPVVDSEVGWRRCEADHTLSMGLLYLRTD